MPLIREEWRDRLHAYMGGIAHRLGAFPKAVGGVADHVHLLAGLPATLALADFMRDLKSFSSKWVREEIGEKKFAWQEGYGAFTVSPSHCETVSEYIGRQEDHRKHTFQDEYLRLLEKCGVAHDGRFLW